MICLQNMRMSCDSTYLLDHETDFGVKADELVTLLDEVLEEPGAKVVIFSQWLRMHELVVRRLNKKPVGHVLFHGGLGGSARKALIERFRHDIGCRAFLSTDAGGVGLNLQHASVVVNMDVPWNPAVSSSASAACIDWASASRSGSSTSSRREPSKRGCCRS
jgi:SNF2 family DNA or RNA helicase